MQKLKKCPACDKEIAATAFRCPGCGALTGTRTAGKLLLGILIISAALAIWLVR